jgi:osmotically-inducible protein OsmY
MWNKLFPIAILLFLPLLLEAQSTPQLDEQSPPKLVAQDTPKGEYDSVAKKLEKKILDQKKVKIDGLKVLHNGDTIYLEGVTDLYGSRYIAGREAAKINGIRKVDNQIAVKSSREISDNEIQAELIRRINNRLKGTPFDLVGVEVNHGFVKLSGSVRDQSLPEKIFQDAIWLPGVRDVQNEIQLASISAGDERLRQVIFNRLNREYPQYFIGKQPSIIIVVDGGRVLLAGYVNSEVEKQKISSTVRSINGVLSLSNQLKASSQG